MSNLDRRLTRIAREIDAIPDPGISLMTLPRLLYAEPVPKLLNLVGSCPMLIGEFEFKLSPTSWWGGLGDGRGTTRRPLGAN
jgi:hypothetical protein